jgi:hypothetical protein
MRSAQAPDSHETNLFSNVLAGPVWRRRFDLVAAAWLLRSASLAAVGSENLIADRIR